MGLSYQFDFNCLTLNYDILSKKYNDVNSITRYKNRNLPKVNVQVSKKSKIFNKLPNELKNLSSKKIKYSLKKWISSNVKNYSF